MDKSIIYAVRDILEKARRPSMTMPLWGAVANAVSTKVGLDLSAEQCKHKWNNVKSSYNRTKDLLRKSGAGGFNAILGTQTRKLSREVFDIMDEEFHASAASEPPFTVEHLDKDVRKVTRGDDDDEKEKGAAVPPNLDAEEDATTPPALGDEENSEAEAQSPPAAEPAPALAPLSPSPSDSSSANNGDGAAAASSQGHSAKRRRLSPGKVEMNRRMDRMESNSSAMLDCIRLQADMERERENRHAQTDAAIVSLMAKIAASLPGVPQTTGPITNPAPASPAGPPST